MPGSTTQLSQVASSITLFWCTNVDTSRNGTGTSYVRPAYGDFSGPQNLLGSYWRCKASMIGHKRWQWRQNQEQKKCFIYQHTGTTSISGCRRIKISLVLINQKFVLMRSSHDGELCDFRSFESWGRRFWETTADREVPIVLLKIDRDLWSFSHLRAL